MSSQAIFEETINHYLAPIRPYLSDPAVSEVMINHAEEIYIEKDGQLTKVDVKFPDQESYRAAVNNVLQYTGRSLYDEDALVDSRLPDGSRVHVAKPPCARKGIVMTIRKFSKMMLDVDWLVELGTMTEAARDYMHLAVVSERNMLVSGGTSAGKTSLLNALSKFIPESSRIVLIEDSAELQLQKPHVLSMESKPADRYGRGAVGIRELFRSSLRLRPDRIVIGEVRGGEALDMIQAMTSGHGGSMGTLHADSPIDTLNRLETMALMSKVELPLHAIRSQIASAIDVLVQMSRHIGGRRMVTQIAEVYPLGEDGRYVTRDIFRMQYDKKADEDDPATAGSGEKTLQLKWTGERSSFADQLDPEQQAMVTPAIEGIFQVDETL